MAVNPTYPGIYIEELPSSTHTITAAPTSVTVFIGYVNPFKTPLANFNVPIELFSFTDYETNFGGFFQSDMFTADEQAGYFSDLANAVNQFFLNGGGIAWVVGLQAIKFSAIDIPSIIQATPCGTQAASIPPQQLNLVQIGTSTYLGGEIVTVSLPVSLSASVPPSASVSPLALVFNASEFTDCNHVLTINVSIPTVSTLGTPSTDTIVDIQIIYGPPANSQSTNVAAVTESYRQVNLTTQSDPNYIGTRINGVSSLVSVVTPVQALTPGATVIPNTPGQPYSSSSQGLFSANISTATTPSFPVSPPSVSGALVFKTSDFTNALQADTPLDKLSIFNLMVLPGVSDFGTLETAASFCERKLAFLIMDPPPGDSADGTVNGYPNLIQNDVSGSGITPIPKSQNAALYFPYLQSPDPVTGLTIFIPPSATVAGIYAATDSSRGVWKAPAGLAATLTNIIDVVPWGKMSDMRQGVLNQLGINCIRTFPASGPVVWGARTSVAANTAFAQWKYVPVRRMALFLEQSLYFSLGWVVFEPNADPLWTAIVTSIQAFMLGLYQQGAFQGTTPSQAFQVKCDNSTTTQADIDNGIVNIVVAFAPLKPAEFVIIQIAQLAGQTQTS